VHRAPGRARSLGRRYALLGKIARAHTEWASADADATAGRELAQTDASFAEELPGLDRARDEAAERLRALLIPRDPDDGRDTIMEIKAGEGGEESALFAADLLRMYTRYAERQGWNVELIALNGTELGGVKDATVAIKSRAGGDDDGVWAHLKYEGGVHRVQRVPVTESQGRIHTSAAGVLVMPEADDPEEIVVDPADIKVDVYRSSGPGGQSVNTTDSAVRITHLPTGIVVSMQNEKSQLQNKEQALRILRARLLAVRAEETAAAASDARRSQIRTVDRSERIRTYNFPENRIADHRTGYKAYNLDRVLDGELGPVVRSAMEAGSAERLAALGQ
jgi:peptide chain release factor 1